MDSTECGVARHLALSMPLTRDFISCLLYLSKSTTLRMYWTSLWSAPSPRPVKSNIQCIPSMTVSMSQSSARVYLPSSNLLASFLPHTQILTEFIWDNLGHLIFSSRSILFSSPPSWFNFEQLPSSSSRSSKGAGSTAQLLLHEIHDWNPSVSFSWSTVITAILQLLLPLIYLESQRSQAVIWHFYQKASSTHLAGHAIVRSRVIDLLTFMASMASCRHQEDWGFLMTALRCDVVGGDGKMARWQNGKRRWRFIVNMFTPIFGLHYFGSSFMCFVRVVSMNDWLCNIRRTLPDSNRHGTIQVLCDVCFQTDVETAICRLSTENLCGPRGNKAANHACK